MTQILHLRKEFLSQKKKKKKKKQMGTIAKNRGLPLEVSVTKAKHNIYTRPFRCFSHGVKVRDLYLGVTLSNDKL